MQDDVKIYDNLINLKIRQFLHASCHFCSLFGRMGKIIFLYGLVSDVFLILIIK